MSEAPSARRILLASLIGTAVEFYDFYIYATAASLVFGPLFFPASSTSALAVENAPAPSRARYGMFPQLGAPVGFIAANGGFLLLGLALSAEDFRAWGWRLPFIASVVLVGVGLWVRLRITETPAFAAASATEKPPRVPIAELVREHFKPLIAGTFAVVACFAIFYLSTAFALGYGTTTLGHERETFLGVQLGAILFMALGIVVSGYASDRFNARHVLMTGCVLTIPGVARWRPSWRKRSPTAAA